MEESVMDDLEFRRRVTKGESLVIFEGGVYDLQGFTQSHPGGFQILEEYIGRDITEAFRGLEDGIHDHSRSALKQLLRMRIGSLGSRDKNMSSSQNLTHSQDFGLDRSKAIVFQVGRLGRHYHEWVHSPDMNSEPMRFFQHPFLEYFSGTSWWLVPLVWLPIAACSIIHTYFYLQTPFSFVVQLMLAGLIFWMLLEYCFHRFVLHHVPSTYWGITFHFLLHGCHHKRPMDPLRLVFPPVLALPLVLLNLAGMLSLLQLPAALSLFGGALTGYVCYDMTHFYLHHGSISQRTYMGFLKSIHLAHHYKNHTSSYGVTSPLFDYIFSTRPIKMKQ